jgi:chromosome segregation ATPase
MSHPINLNHSSSQDLIRLLDQSRADHFNQQLRLELQVETREVQFLEEREQRSLLAKQLAEEIERANLLHEQLVAERSRTDTLAKQVQTLQDLEKKCETLEKTRRISVLLGSAAGAGYLGAILGGPPGALVGATAGSAGAAIGQFLKKIRFPYCK